MLHCYTSFNFIETRNVFLQLLPPFNNPAGKHGRLEDLIWRVCMKKFCKFILILLREIFTYHWNSRVWNPLRIHDFHRPPLLPNSQPTGAPEFDPWGNPAGFLYPQFWNIPATWSLHPKEWSEQREDGLHQSTIAWNFGTQGFTDKQGHTPKKPLEKADGPIMISACKQQKIEHVSHKDPK